MKHIFILFSLVLAGCSTTQQTLSDAKKTPTSRLYAYQEIANQNTGTIVVTRDIGALGSACYSYLAINGEMSARLDVGETATFYVAPGETLLKVGRDPMGKGLCGFESKAWTQRETIIRPRETKYFRLTTDTHGKSDIQRTDP